MDNRNFNILVIEGWHYKSNKIEIYLDEIVKKNMWHFALYLTIGP
jgi:hypothetical protein